MRILWVTPNSLIGAVGRGTAEGSSELARRGHDTHVILPGPGPLRELLSGHSAVHVVPHNAWVIHGARRTTRELAYNATVAARRLASLIRDIDADVVLTETIQMPMGALAARRVGVPHVWFVHALPQAEHPMPRLILGTHGTLRAIGHLSDAVLCVSEAVRTEAAPSLGNTPLRTVHWAAEIPSVEPRPRPNDAFRLVLVGRKSPGKGQDDALRALRILLDRGLNVELDLVGSSAPGYEPRLLELATELALDAHSRFIPETDNALALVAASDVALVCSRRDACPRVTIEAMKLRVPVVAAADYGLLEQVQHERTGLLYTPGDADQLADDIERLYRNPKQAHALAEAGFRWANEHFNLTQYGDQLEQAFDAVGRPD